MIHKVALCAFILILYINISQCIANLDGNKLLELAKGNPQSAFLSWAELHGRSYADKRNDKEHIDRFRIWKANLDYIVNKVASGFKMELNEFADMTWDEFAAQRLGLQGGRAKQLHTERLMEKGQHFAYAGVEAPEALDWRERNVVTNVKNQGQCGSCWSFAATGAIESVNAIKTGELVALSEQQLVDCDTEKNMGCGGGLMDFAYEYVMKNGGLDTEENYAYWSSWGITLWSCNRRKEADRTAVSINSYANVPEGEDNLLKAVSQQPVSVGICAGPSLMFYAGGVLDTGCEGLNHGVLVVGYGSEPDGTPYWIVKNSWGAGWGEEGYFRLKRTGGGGLSGIATVASYPVKTEPNHPVPQMCDIFGWTECSVTDTCSCKYSLFGLLCLWHDCCPLENGVTCDDMVHCCPGEAPVCDVQQGRCISEDGERVVPWTDKTQAALTTVGSGRPMSRLQFGFAPTKESDHMEGERIGARKGSAPKLIQQ